MPRRFRLLAGCQGFGVIEVGRVGAKGHSGWRAPGGGGLPRGGWLLVLSGRGCGDALNERPIAQLHAVLGSCVFHAAPGGKGNSLAQLNTSFVFIKRMGMLVLAGGEDV